MTQQLKLTSSIDSATGTGVQLELYRDNPLALSSEWGNLPKEQRHRRAVVALRDSDSAELQDLLIAHMTLFRGQASPMTVRTYRAGIRNLIRTAERAGLSLIQPQEDFAGLYIRALERAGLASATVRLHAGVARQLYAAARWAGLNIPDPWEGRRFKFRNDAVQRVPYSEREVKKLLTSPNLRVRVGVLLGAHAGLRAAEMCGLVWSDIDLEREELTVRHGKGNRARTVPLTSPLLSAIQALPQGADDQALWTGYDALRDSLKTAAKATSVTWRGIHSLRHTAGTELYRASGDLYLTAQLLGHSSISTTQIYVHMSQAQLRAALKKRAG